MPARDTSGLSTHELASRFGLDDHYDVDDAAKGDGKFLKWDAASGTFVYADPSAPGAHVLATTSGLGTSHTVSGLTAGQVLRAGGANTAWFVALSAADIASGILPVARGGTGVDAVTTGYLLVGAGTGALSLLAPGAAGGFARSNGSAWVRATIQDSDLGSGTPSASTFLRGDRTWAAPTAVLALGDLTDGPQIAPLDGQVLAWDDASGHWEPTNP